MLVATPTEGFRKGQRIKAHGIVNRGGWFGNNWLIVVSIANALHAAIIVEAEHSQAAIDELADSPTWSHLIDCDECWYCGSDEFSCGCEYAQVGGNDSHRINTDNVSLYGPVDVEYFAKDTGGWN